MCLLRVRRLLVDVMLPVAAEADDERTVEVDVGDDSARLVVDTVVIGVVDNFGLPAAAEADDERTVEVDVGDDSARLVVDTGVEGSSPPVLKIGPGTAEGGRSTIIVAVIGSVHGLVALRLVSVS